MYFHALQWPVCHALISFYSTGFPMEKALAYNAIVKPFLVNDLEAQTWYAPPAFYRSRAFGAAFF